MGQQQSIRKRSDIEHIDKNLEWSLNEQSKWEMRSVAVQEILSFNESLTVTQPSTSYYETDSSPTQHRTLTTLGEEIELQHAREVLSAISEIVRVRGGESVIEQHYKKYNGLLVLQEEEENQLQFEDRLPSSSRLLSRIALENAVLVNPYIEHIMNQASTEKTQNNINEFYPLFKQKRGEILSKYVFTHTLLTKLVQSAIYCFKMRLRYQQLLKKQKKLQHKIDVAIEDEVKSTNSSLMTALRNFDHTRVAIIWLAADYILNYCLHRLDTLSARIKVWRSELSNNVNQLDKGLSQRIIEIDKMLIELSNRRKDILLELQVNERDSLFVGLNYLGFNNEGNLNMSDCSDIPADMVVFFEINNHQSLTPLQFDKCLDKLVTRLLNNSNELFKFQSDTLRISKLSTINEMERQRLLNNQGEIAKREMEIKLDKKIMKETYNYFIQSFVKNVQAQIAVPSTELDVASLFVLSNNQHFSSSNNKLADAELWADPLVDIVDESTYGSFYFLSESESELVPKSQKQTSSGDGISIQTA